MNLPDGTPRPEAASPPTPESWPIEFDLKADAVAVRWSAMPGAIRYFLEMASDPALLHRLWVGTTETTEALAPLHGFIPRGPVYVRLEAVNAADEPIAVRVTSSFLGRQTNLPQGITGLTVMTRPAPSVPPPPPKRSLRWGAPLLSRELTLVSGSFGGETYTNYLVSHGLDWSASSPAATVNTGARLLYTTNDREGFALQRGDMNLSTYFLWSGKRMPLTLTWNGSFYQSLAAGRVRTVQNLGLGYRVSPRLTTGAQVTLNPRYVSAWGSWGLRSGAVTLMLNDSAFSRAVTLTWQSQQWLRGGKKRTPPVAPNPFIEERGG